MKVYLADTKYIYQSCYFQDVFKAFIRYLESGKIFNEKVTKYFVMMVKISNDFGSCNKSSLSSTSSFSPFGWDALKYDLIPRIPVRYRVRKILPVNSGTRSRSFSLNEQGHLGSIEK